MPLILKPDYMYRTMAKDDLRGMEAVYLTGYIFNVATRDERVPVKCKCIGTNKNWWHPDYGSVRLSRLDESRHLVLP